MNLESISQISLPKIMNVFSKDRFNMSFFFFFIAYHTSDVDFMDLDRFTLGTILYSKVVQAM